MYDNIYYVIVHLWGHMYQRLGDTVLQTVCGEIILRCLHKKIKMVR